MKEDGKKPGEFTRPFLKDPADTIIKDPIGDLPVSEEFKQPRERAEAPIGDGFAARWQEHSYDVTAGEAGAAWDDGVCVELARFIAPPGTQGRVHILETAAIQYPLESGPPFDGKCCSCPWGYDYMAEYTAIPALGFHLRLDSYRRGGCGPGPDIFADANGLPGTPHPSLGEWHDTRYDFGRARGPVSLFVPEGTFLRLFGEFHVSPRHRFDRLWGRLAGITQHYRGNVEALIASRAWPG